MLRSSRLPCQALAGRAVLARLAARLAGWLYAHRLVDRGFGRFLHAAGFVLVPVVERHALFFRVAAQAGHHVEGSRPLWPSKSGPSTQANLTLSPTLTRQPPHMPVPSTISGLRLTMVLDAVGPRRVGASLHHDHRADGDDFVDIPMALDRLFEAESDEALDADRAVVGADDEFIAAGAELVVPEDEVLVAEANDADDVGAGFLVSAGLRIDRRDAEAAADADDLARVADGARHTHRADECVERGADLAGVLHFARGLADGLDHQRDRAFVDVVVGDGQWDAFAMLVKHDDDELSGLGRLGH